MIFYMQMRWNIEGRLRLDEVWDLEIEEAKAAKDGFKLIAMYKVAGQRRVIAIVEIETAEDLDSGDSRAPSHAAGSGIRGDLAPQEL
jgi:muconolactone D-isomerase